MPGSSTARWSPGSSGSSFRRGCSTRVPGSRRIGVASVAVGIRPEHLLDPAVRPDLPTLRADVRFTEALPPDRLVYASVVAQPVVTDEVMEIAKDVDEAAVERLEELADEHFVMVCARFDSSSDTPQRGPYAFAVNLERAHFFDLETGAAIR